MQRLICGSWRLAGRSPIRCYCNKKGEKDPFLLLFSTLSFYAVAKAEEKIGSRSANLRIQFVAKFEWEKTAWI